MNNTLVLLLEHPLPRHGAKARLGCGARLQQPLLAAGGGPGAAQPRGGLP